MRTIASVSVGRSDYSIYLPVYRRLLAEPGLHLELIVAAAHLADEFGRTVEAIERDGLPIAARVEMTLPGDAPLDIARSMSAGLAGFAQAYARLRPDLLLVLGDRFEMLAAVAAALPFNLPVAHLHGGEETQGAIDDAIRHAITKMSHLHFAALPQYAQRIVQMGEEPWRVTVSGAPALDHLRTLRPLGREELRGRGVGVPPADEPFLLVAFHPVTREPEQTQGQLGELLAALDEAALPAIITYPNADTRSRTIIARLREYAASRPRHALVTHLGTECYFSVMNEAAAMVGNSSSGIIEAASFRLPVVNVGNRQRGRLHGANVLDVPCQRGPITAAIRRAIAPAFRAALSALVNPYGDGHAAERIVGRLKGVALGPALLAKSFHLAAPAEGAAAAALQPARPGADA